MNPTNSTYRKLLPLLMLGLVLGVSFIAYRVYATERDIQKSGILQVETPAPATTISVTQENHAAVYIGKGSSRTRLLPGTYLLSGKIGGQQDTKVVAVEKGKVSYAKLNPTAETTTPTTTPTGFINFDSLVDNGLSSDQETYTETMFSLFKPTAKVIAVDTDSVTLNVPDASNGNLFTMNFDVTIDTVQYHGTLQYSGYQSVTLTLKDTTGTQVYSGYQPVSKDT